MSQSDRSIEERLRRLELRQEAILQRQNKVIEAAERTNAVALRTLQLLQNIPSQTNDNHNN